MGGDQTSVGDEGRGGQLLFCGMKGEEYQGGRE